MIYLGDNKFGLGQSCSLMNLMSLKKEIRKHKTNPLYVSHVLIPKEFNSIDKVEVIGIVALKKIPTAPANMHLDAPSFAYAAKPKKDYSKMRILNRDS